MMVQRNEHKRRQSAPGIRITRRAFGRDRRYPITSGIEESKYVCHSLMFVSGIREAFMSPGTAESPDTNIRG